MGCISLSRYKLILQYDGSAFFGWQLQAKERTIQGEIEKALQKISRSKVRIPIHGAGRTDTGVHAFRQTAHVDLDTNLCENELKNAINGNLPPDCRLGDIEKVHKNFHARFDAKMRHYRYQCYTGESILYENQTWIVPYLDIRRLNKLAYKIIGNHDFLSFSKHGANIKHTNCIINKSEWMSDGKMLIFSIVGNRFLHHMVRYLVGTMVAVVEERFLEKDFLALLKNPQKNVQILKAPAKGLIREKVEYD